MTFLPCVLSQDLYSYLTSHHEVFCSVCKKSLSHINTRSILVTDWDKNSFIHFQFTCFLGGPGMEGDCLCQIISSRALYWMVTYTLSIGIPCKISGWLSGHHFILNINLSDTNIFTYLYPFYVQKWVIKQKKVISAFKGTSM